MRKLLMGAIGVMFASCGFGQLDSYTVTITTSRAASIQADQIQFSVYVDAPMTSSLTDAAAVVAGLGLKASDLSSVYTYTTQEGLKRQTVLEWAFSLTAPIGSMTSTVAAVENLAQTVAKGSSGMTVAFDVDGLVASAASQNAQNCPVTAMMADARAQAQKLGSAAGFGVGQVMAVSDASPPEDLEIADASRVSYAEFVIIGQFQNPAPVLACTLVVKFRLLPS
jgi:hypothetical protein